MPKLFKTSLLLSALNSENERVAVWGAYQMLLLKPNEIHEHLNLFLQSPFWEIVDAGLTKAVELNAKEYTPQILQIFRSANGQLKNTAAYCLSQFPNDFSRMLLQKWFEQLTASDYTTRLELESAVYAYIQIDPANHLKRVLSLLPEIETDLIKSVILLITALPFCEKDKDIDTIFQQYFILRDLYSDTELTYQIILHYGDMEVQDWISDRLTNGYSIKTIFEKCYDLLGLQASLLESHCWQEIDQVLLDTDDPHASIPKDYDKLIETIKKLCDHLQESLVISSDSQTLIRILDLFEKNRKQLTANIHKIIHLEYHFLLSIPFLILLDYSLSKWFAKPNQYLKQIAEYYHSTLLTSRFMEEILALFFSTEPDWPLDKISISSNKNPIEKGTSKAEILWNFYQGEYLGFEIDWAGFFPNPAGSDFLVNGLIKIYCTNFDYYIEQKNSLAIDYALSLFQLKPREEKVNLLLRHFDYLYRYHGEMLLQTTEYIPSPDFFNILTSKYQGGEYETAELILFLGEVFKIPLPSEIENFVNKDLSLKKQKSGIKKRFRLHCESCGSTFQYVIDKVYVDEGSIYKSGQLSMESIWIPKNIKCKKCDAAVPFHLDKLSLENLTQQSRVDRITRFSGFNQPDNLTLAVVLIEFPRFEGVVYNPVHFEKLVKNLENSSKAKVQDLKILRMKLVRIYQILNRWDDSIDLLNKINPEFHMEIEWRFLLGLAGFNLQRFAFAKEHFDWVIAKYEDDRKESMGNHFAEQAQYFLTEMTSYNSKRARFKVIDKKL